MQKKYFTLILLLSTFLVIFSLGCKRESVLDNPINPVPPTTTPTVINDLTQVTASVSGIVLDESNAPIANAVVTSGAAATTTNSNGMFIFQNISLSKENGSITVVKAGYFKGIRSFKTTAGKNHTVRLQLMQKVLSGSINAAAGGTINSNGGATIIFPAAAFVTSTGAAYTGTVNVYSRWINPTAANLPFIIPGDLRGVGTDGAENLLETYGMVGAELEDVSGNLLKIATGKKATISFPLPTSLQASAPATIQLWHFDDATARWKENGTATRTGTTFTAQVDKFSFWNCDVANGNFINLDYTLINATTNSPLVSTSTRIRRANGSYGSGITGNTGFVSGLVPRNEQLVLEVISNGVCGSVFYSQNIGPFNTNTSLGNINLTTPVAQTITFTGTLLNCSGAPVSNGYISIASGNGFGGFANTNSTGAFSLSVVSCSGTNISYNYQGVDNSTNLFSPINSGNVTSTLINLSNISICNSVSNSNIYITTTETNNAGKNILKVWKNGVATTLVNGNTNGEVKSVFVNGNDVYVAGKFEIIGGLYVANVWKNGISNQLTNGSQTARANSIYVNGNDVYVAGEVLQGSAGYLATVWKNGISTNLTFGLTGGSAYTHSIFVSGNDVYVAGQEFSAPSTNIRIAKVWKNGVANDLTVAGQYGNAFSVFVVGNDVYVAGETRNVNTGGRIPKLWKNGVSINLPLSIGSLDASTHSVYVSGLDVYVAGEESTASGKLVAKLWKNGVGINLTDGTKDAVANSVHVFGNDVYVAGYEGLNAVYWKNGFPVIFANGTPGGIYSPIAVSATSIFVN